MSSPNRPWRAHWLWAGGDSLKYRWFTNTYVLLRAVVNLPAEPESAVVRVTADTRYRLWVNGTHAVRGPARGYPASLPYDELDLCEWLWAGDNVLAIQAHCVGTNTFSSEFDGRPGVLLDGAARLADGSEVRLDTHPERWLAREADGYRRHVHRSSVQTGWQEDCDLRRLPDGWLLAADSPEGWRRAVDLGPHPQPPWLELEPRGLPLWTETPRDPEALTGVFTAVQSAEHDRILDLSAPLVEEDYQPEPDAAVTDGDWLEVPARSDGRAVAVLFDLGLTCLGHPELEISAADDGMVDLAYAERLLPNGFIATRPPEDTQPRHVDRFRLRPGAQTAEVFNPRGYRYLAVIVRDATAPVRFRRPRLHGIQYPVPQRGGLVTGDDLLDRIWQIGVTTLRRNMTDAYTDCPWREQAQWWGDARVEFMLNAYSLGDVALLARGVRQCAQAQLPDGLMHGVFPGKGPILPDYNFVWVETLWDHYEHTGSDALLRQWAEVLRRNLAWFRDHTDANGLLDPPEGTWLFLDWAPLYRGRYSTVYNLRYLAALATAAQVFGAIGANLEADACIGRGMMTALSLTRAVFDPDQGVWYDGYNPDTGERVEPLSAHAQALAILLGLEPQSHRKLCEEILIPVMRRERDDVVAPSPFFSAFVLEALVERGYHEEVVDIIRRRWGEWVAQGHPTWPEEWDPERSYNLSLCHAWSGAPTYLLSRILLGVKRLSPGWRRVLLAPRRCGLTSVSGCVPSPLGNLEVAWQVDEGEWLVWANLPPGVTAAVDLDDGQIREAEPGENAWQLPA